MNCITWKKDYFTCQETEEGFMDLCKYMESTTREYHNRSHSPESKAKGNATKSSVESEKSGESDVQQKEHK